MVPKMNFVWDDGGRECSFEKNAFGMSQSAFVPLVEPECISNTSSTYVSIARSFVRLLIRFPYQSFDIRCDSACQFLHDHCSEGGNGGST